MIYLEGTWTIVRIVFGSSRKDVSGSRPQLYARENLGRCAYSYNVRTLKPRNCDFMDLLGFGPLELMDSKSKLAEEGGKRWFFTPFFY